MSTSVPSPLRRALAATVAAGVGAAGLTMLPAAPASAAPAPVALQWQISQQFQNHLCVQTFDGGATEGEGGVVTFPEGEGTFDAQTGVTEIQYAGSVRGGFAPGAMGACNPDGTPVYAVTLADPVVSVDPTGAGEISALVSTTVEPATPTRVVLTTFEATAADWTVAEGVGTLTATPDWAGVLPEGPESVELGIPAGQPVEGKAWSTDLLGALPQSLRAHFYFSSGSDAKAPSSFTATAPLAAGVDVAVTKADRSGVTLSVTGSGFTEDVLPGGNGGYVGIAPAGGVPPGLGQAEGIAYFAGVSWVMQHQITDGSFATTLDVPRAELDPRKKYAVYVWPGHTSWSADTSTETPLAISWKALGFPLKAKAAVTLRKPTPKRQGKVTVALSGAHVKPFGKVTVVWAKGRKRKVWTPRLRNGRAVVVLPRTPKGKWKLAVRTARNPVYQAVLVKRTVRVTR